MFVIYLRKNALSTNVASVPSAVDIQTLLDVYVNKYNITFVCVRVEIHRDDGEGGCRCCV